MNAGSIIATLKLKVDEFKQGMEDAKQELTNFSDRTKTIAGMAGAAIAGIGVVAAGVGAAAIKMASDNEAAAAKMQAATGSTKEEMVEFKQVADSLFDKALGNHEEIYGALTQIKSVLGLTGDEAGKAAEQALILSKTFGWDVRESVRAVDSAVKNFGVSSAEGFDMIGALAQQAGDKADDLLDTINEYSPIVNQMGLSFQDFGNILAEGMEQGAFNFDKIGDALKEFNIRAQDGSKTTVAAFQTLGMNADVMGQKFAAGGEAGKQAFFEVLSGIAAIQDPMKQNEVGVQLFGTMWEDLGKKVILSMGNAEGALKNVNGTTAQMGETLNNNLGHKVEMIKNQFMSWAADVMAGRVMPQLGQLADWVLTNMPMILAVAGNVFGTLASIIGGVADVLGTVIGFVIQNKELFLALAAVITGAILPALIGMITQMTILKVQALKQLITSFIGWITTNYALAASQIAAYWPILLIIAGIGLLVAAILWLIKNWDTVKAVTLAVWESIKAFLLSTWEAIKAAGTAVWEAMKAAFTAAWDAIKAAGMAVWNAIKVAFTAVWEAIKWYFTTVLNIYKTIFTTAWNVIKTVGITIWNGIKAAFTATWSAIKSVFTTVWNSVTSVFTNVVNKIKSLGSSAWSFLKDGFSGAINFVVGTFKGLYDKVIGSLNNLIGGIKDKVMKAKEWLTELNPFKRHSPSLVDNVLAGVDLIKKTYAGVSDMEIAPPTIGTVTAGHYAAGMFEGDNASGAAGGATNYNAPLVHVENMQVRDDRDVRNISSELYNLQRNADRKRGR